MLRHHDQARPVVTSRITADEASWRRRAGLCCAFVTKATSGTCAVTNKRPRLFAYHFAATLSSRPALTAPTTSDQPSSTSGLACRTSEARRRNPLCLKSARSPPLRHAISHRGPPASNHLPPFSSASKRPTGTRPLYNRTHPAMDPQQGQQQRQEPQYNLQNGGHYGRLLPICC